MRETSRKLKKTLKFQNPCLYFHLFKYNVVLKDSCFLCWKGSLRQSHEKCFFGSNWISMVEIKTSILNFLVSFVKCYCVKSVQIRSFFWSWFSRNWTEYGYGEMRSISPYSVRMRKIRTRKNSVFRHFTECICK